MKNPLFEKVDIVPYSTLLDAFQIKSKIEKQVSFRNQMLKNAFFNLVKPCKVKNRFWAQTVDFWNQDRGKPRNFFTVSGTVRMVPAEASILLTGSKRSVPVDKTLKATLLSILNNVGGKRAKSNVFGFSKQLKNNRCKIS